MCPNQVCNGQIFFPVLFLRHKGLQVCKCSEKANCPTPSFYCITSMHQCCKMTVCHQSLLHHNHHDKKKKKTSKTLAACSHWSSENRIKDTVGHQLHGGSERVMTAASHRLSGGLQVEDPGRGDGRTSLRRMYTHSFNTDTGSVCIFSHNGQQHCDVIWLPSCKSRKTRRVELGKTNVWINQCQSEF